MPVTHGCGKHFPIDKTGEGVAEVKGDDGTRAESVAFKIRYADGTEIVARTSDDGVLMVHGSKERSWNIVQGEDSSIAVQLQ